MARALQNRLTHLLNSRSTPSCLQVSQLHRSGGVSQRFWNLLNLENSQRNNNTRRDPATKPDCSMTTPTKNDPRLVVLKGSKPSVGELLSKWCRRFNDKFHQERAPQLPYYRHRAPQLPRRPCSQAPFCPTKPPPEPCPEPKPCDTCEEPKSCPSAKSCAPRSGKRPSCPKPAKPCGTCRKPKPKPCPKPSHSPPCDPCKKPKRCDSNKKPSRCPKPYPPNPGEACPRLPTCNPARPCPPCPRPEPSCPKPRDPCDPCRPKHTPMGNSLPMGAIAGPIGMPAKGTRSQMRGFHKSAMKSNRSNDSSRSGEKSRKRGGQKAKKTRPRKNKAVRSNSMSSGKVFVKPRGKRRDTGPKKGPASENDDKLK